MCLTAYKKSKFGTNTILLFQRYILIYRIYSITSVKRSHPQSLQLAAGGGGGGGGGRQNHANIVNTIINNVIASFLRIKEENT